MDKLAFPTLIAFVAFIIWELISYIQLRITKQRDAKLNKNK